ncbi:MAG: hypothetical protein K1X66_00690 [Verrucomicrobiae bacterium]|nr:hypothetical protein [Verrucomicrobiae bacterium]
MNLFKNTIAVVIITLIFRFVTQAVEITDPIADYLVRSQEILLGRFERRYYLSDKVYRFDIDLNNDSKKEVLVSSSLDRDGKQGNLFHVYKQVKNGVNHVGQILLYPNGFYLGRIDEINAYGIIKWGTAGGGTGGYTAYIFDGEKIIEKDLGYIRRNEKTYELEGKGIEIAAKYFTSVSDTIVDKVERLRAERGYKPNRSAFVSSAKEIGSDELSRKYGVRVDPRTYEQALDDEMAKESKTNTAPIPGSK